MAKSVKTVKKNSPVNLPDRYFFISLQLLRTELLGYGIIDSESDSEADLFTNNILYFPSILLCTEYL